MEASYSAKFLFSKANLLVFYFLRKANQVAKVHHSLCDLQVRSKVFQVQFKVFPSKTQDFLLDFSSDYWAYFISFQCLLPTYTPKDLQVSVQVFFLDIVFVLNASYCRRLILDLDCILFGYEYIPKFTQAHGQTNLTLLYLHPR